MATLKYKTEDGYVSIPMTVPTKSNEENGNGIGTCDTSSGTALAVTLSGYELVVNGFVAVTFLHDVPAGATLNVNGKGAKPIYYKGSAITADTIKADDTVMFCYDGTNYVVTSPGGGGAVALKETVIISLLQYNGTDADLEGATIVVEDDDSGDTLLSTTWQGYDISLDVESGITYTITVGSVTGYMTPSSQSYQALPSFSRDVEFVYNNNLGVYIESLNGKLYSSSRWDSSDTANSIVLLTSNVRLRIALTYASKPIEAELHHNITTYVSPVAAEAIAKTDYAGKTKTDQIINYCNAFGINNTSYAAPYCKAYTFRDGTNIGYFPSLGQVNAIYLNKTNINTCLSTIGATQISGEYVWSSTIANRNSASNDQSWYLTWGNGVVGTTTCTGSMIVIPVADYV